MPGGRCSSGMASVEVGPAGTIRLHDGHMLRPSGIAAPQCVHVVESLTPASSTGHEVLGLRVVADDRGGGLLGLELEAGVLADLDADALGLEQLRHRLVVLEVRAGGIAPRVAAAAVLLAE